MYKTLVRSGPVLAALAFLSALDAQAINTFYPASNLLSIDAISVDGASYQNVLMTLNSVTVLGVDNGAPGSDTFKPSTRLLTLGSLLFQGNVYNNVRIQLNSVTVSAATLVTGAPNVSTPSSPATPVPVVPGVALSSERTCSLSNFQTDVMALINQARASSRTCGNTTYPAAAPLAWSNKLFDPAAGHSADMANNNYFSHTSLDGRTFSQRIVSAGYNWSRLGENIAAGQNSVASVMATWMASPGHCGNIMNGNFTEVGMACVVNNSSTYRTYWTMDLGRP